MNLPTGKGEAMKCPICGGECSFQMDGNSNLHPPNAWGNCYVICENGDFSTDYYPRATLAFEEYDKAVEWAERRADEHI